MILLRYIGVYKTSATVPVACLNSGNCCKKRLDCRMQKQFDGNHSTLILLSKQVYKRW